MDVVALHRDPRRNLDRLVADRIVVAIILERIGAVGDLRDGCPGKTLGRVDDFLHRRLVGLEPVLLAEADDAPLGRDTARILRTQIAKAFARIARVVQEYVDDVLVENALLEDAHRRDAQALRIDVWHGRRIASRPAAADVDIMAAHSGIADDLPGEKDRLRHDEIGQVVVSLIRIVLVDDVAWFECFRRDAFETGAERHRHRGEMDRNVADPLHRKLAAAGQQAAG